MKAKVYTNEDGLSPLMNNESYLVEKPKLLNKINRKEFEQGLIFNSLILILANINTGQFCFPFMIQSNGWATVVITLVCLIALAFVIQRSIVQDLIENRNNESCCYGKLVEKYLNTLYSNFLELFLFLWLISSCIICFMVTLKALSYFSQNSTITYSCSLTVFSLLYIGMQFNTKSTKFFNILPYISSGIQILTMAVSSQLIN